MEWYLPLLSVDKAGVDEENQSASNELSLLVSVAVVVEYTTPPTFSSTIRDVITSGYLRSRDDWRHVV